MKINLLGKSVMTLMLMTSVAFADGHDHHDHDHDHHDHDHHHHHHDEVKRVEVKSPLGFDETVSSIQNFLDGRKLMQPIVFDHTKNAKTVGLNLRKTKVIVFGNPKVGTYVMVDVPELALELPLKIAVVENKDKSVSVFYNDPMGYAKKYKLSKKGLESVKRMSAVIKGATNFKK